MTERVEIIKVEPEKGKIHFKILPEGSITFGLTFDRMYENVINAAIVGDIYRVRFNGWIPKIEEYPTKKSVTLTFYSDNEDNYYSH